MASPCKRMRLSADDDNCDNDDEVVVVADDDNTLSNEVKVKTARTVTPAAGDNGDANNTTSSLKQSAIDSIIDPPPGVTRRNLYSAEVIKARYTDDILLQDLFALSEC